MTTTALAASKAYSQLQNLGGLGAGGTKISAPSTSAMPEGDFGSMLGNHIGQLGDMAKVADQKSLGMASNIGNLTDVVTAVAEAETAIQTLAAVRDRVISAYEEIMRMPV